MIQDPPRLLLDLDIIHHISPGEYTSLLLNDSLVGPCSTSDLLLDRSTELLRRMLALLSFFVVALPHFLPCPAPRGVYADDGEIIDAKGRKRRRRRPQDVEVKNGVAQFDNASENEDHQGKSRRECPVPKPSGVLGQLLGVKKTNNDRDGDQ